MCGVADELSTFGKEAQTSRGRGEGRKNEKKKSYIFLKKKQNFEQRIKGNFCNNTNKMFTGDSGLTALFTDLGGGTGVTASSV